MLNYENAKYEFKRKFPGISESQVEEYLAIIGYKSEYTRKISELENLRSRLLRQQEDICRSINLYKSHLFKDLELSAARTISPKSIQACNGNYIINCPSGAEWGGSLVFKDFPGISKKSVKNICKIQEFVNKFNFEYRKYYYKYLRSQLKEVNAKIKEVNNSIKELQKS